eukprot:TRINITY_DN5312_c0_g2_i14.p1 TRINITY_DN5312_c0_g2~~TRINITY_DN5312_c0_g2_i14.p1  ORF type:complete len:217 (-),score=37.72 TRINITY_DN5312_c0_g2_i14:94-744(-)
MDKASLFLTVLALIAVADAIRFNLEFRTPFCFLEDRPPDTNLHISYEFQKDIVDMYKEFPDNVVLVKIEDPLGEAHMFSIKSYMGVINFPAESGGRYKICFTNKVKVATSITNNIQGEVKFTEAVKLPQMDLNATAAKEETLKKFTDHASVLERRVKDVEKYQEYEILREKVFKDKIEHANKITRWCAVVQGIVFVILAVWQIYSLRKYFAKRGIA